MSWLGLTYKGVEILTPEEWNLVIDALNDLHNRVKGGLASFTGDGSTKTFQITHGVGTTPVSAIVGKGASDLPDLDYWTADETYITVTFKTAPANGATIKLFWLALKPPATP
jgi:hypothetical protein